MDVSSSVDQDSTILLRFPALRDERNAIRRAKIIAEFLRAVDRCGASMAALDSTH